jgi:hypothetical protein
MKELQGSLVYNQVKVGKERFEFQDKQNSFVM